MRLVDAFIPVLAVMRQFVNAPKEDAPALAARLQPMLARAQQDAQVIGTSEDDVRNALFAVVALIDETLLTCDWAQAPAWQRHLLQRQLFGLSHAGVTFFERLAQLDATQSAVEEVYVLCLAMGFKGRFGQGGDDRELTDIRLRSMNRVLAQASARSLPEAAALIFPGVKAAAPGGASAVPRWRWKPSRLSVLVLTVPVLVLIALYLVFFWILEQQVHAILPLIQ
jgi:type VI secretion system protein ImpK